MIHITDKINCCGCQACGDICGKKAISFQTDSEGIWYPIVDENKCIDCGLCEKVCPIINRVSSTKNASTPKCYILQASNSYDRLQSASGAAYTLIARVVFESGGIVAGHIWDGEFGVKGFVTGNEKDLEILRGTKYLQSNVEGIYLTVKRFLKENKLVLFSGTPCQNAAMRSFLNKDYENLILTDFVCMGIDSPLAFKKYLQSLELQYNSKIIYFKAKSKEVGWRYLTNKAVFANGKSYFGIHGRDSNLNATFLNVLVRPSCYNCRYKGFPRVSDMTIGDYWRRIYDYDPLDDNTGTSYVMLHNDKAEHIFEKIKTGCQYREIDFSNIIARNKYATSSLPKPKFNRGEFYNRLKTEDYSIIVDDYLKQTKKHNSILSKTKQVIKSLLCILYYCRHTPLSLIRTLYYNVFCPNVRSSLINGNILVLVDTHVKLSKGATIHLQGFNIFDGKNLPSRIVLGKDSSLSLDNNLIKDGVIIMINDRASVELGYKTIAERLVKIFARTGICFGEFSLIGDDVTIDDTNNDIVYFNEVNKEDRKIIIGTHVLINKGSIIKAGSNLHDETIVREYSVVDGLFGPRVVIGGNPATIVENNLFWKHNFDCIWNYRN